MNLSVVELGVGMGAAGIALALEDKTSEEYRQVGAALLAEMEEEGGEEMAEAVLLEYLPKSLEIIENIKTKMEENNNGI